VGMCATDSRSWGSVTNIKTYRPNFINRGAGPLLRETGLRCCGGICGARTALNGSTWTLLTTYSGLS
jgi:hypothetical protein